MAILNQTIPGTNENGFLSLYALKDEAEKCDAAEFEKRYPAPALHVVEIGRDETEQTDLKENSGVQLLTMLHHGGKALRYLDQVGFLVKRPGNPFPNFVSLGRAGNNDLVVGVETVSKLHAYFTWESGAWHVTDHGSTNGTRLNGRPIEARQAHSLKEGDLLLLGKEITVAFLPPAALHARARA